MRKMLWFALTLIVLCVFRGGAVASPTTQSFPDTGWRLWLDPQAPWQNDTLCLPDEVRLNTMPVHAPTDGWAVLNTRAGIAVSLPGTVEEHYWGQAPARRLNAGDPTNVVDGNGEYDGVSWWYRTFTPPALKPGEHLVFAFPGARLRAEVYVNGRLCGYDVVTETPFTADATAALQPGQPNQLAVRITNPGGNFNWVDFETISWGRYTLPTSHGFGGLSGGITMRVQGPVSVADLAVFNHPDPRTITLRAQVDSTGPAYRGPITLSVSQHGQTVWQGTATVRVAPGGTATATKTVTVPSAVLWDIGKPNLYTAAAAIPSVAHSDRSQEFGFRWFTVTGLGRDAQVRLNGRHIVVKSSISWGYWSPNGMFPDRAAAAREVDAVKQFGLNAIQNHRHMPKPIVLTAFDHAGLLRYCEAGAGCFTYADPPANLPASGPVDTSGRGGESTTFANKYELAKVLAMIKAERSHPSVIIWSLQNEASPNHYNPKIYATLHRMRAADPSRIIMLESGFSTQDQVWALPYSDNLLVDMGHGSGWNDMHTASDSRGMYQDEYYKSATDFKYHFDDPTEVLTWGEMATGASPDDHGVMARWYMQHKTTGYDSAAHAAVDTAYARFLNKYGFRTVFPSADALFRAAADMHYSMDAKMMENARMCGATDYLVLSGWESTVQDNHSGLVDALRFPKTDPGPVKAAAAPAALVIRAPHVVLARGDTASVDVHLLNENVLRGPYTLLVTARQANDPPFFTATQRVTATGGDRFAQVLARDLTLTPPVVGDVTVTATLTAAGRPTPVLTKEEHLYVVDPQPAPLHGTIATLGSPALATALQSQLHVRAVPFASAPADARVIVVGAVSDNATSAASWIASTFDPAQIRGTHDPGLYGQQYYGTSETLAHYDGLANGLAHVTLHFVETWWDAPGKRVFDVALNGQTVLHDFDIYGETGGKGIALAKAFDVPITDGTLTVRVPQVKLDNAIFAALEITDAQGKTVRVVFGPNDYQDAAGHVWRSVTKAFFDWNTVPAEALRRVHDAGARLIFLSSARDASDAEEAARGLAGQSILTYAGRIGDSFDSWLGRWYFAKRNWLLDGLPADGVLDWQYQITGGNGLDIDAPGIEGVIGYGVNHEPHLGLGAAIIPYGRGQIVLFCIPGLAQSFADNRPEGINPITAKRIVYNCLAGPEAAN